MEAPARRKAEDRRKVTVTAILRQSATERKHQRLRLAECCVVACLAAPLTCQ